MPQNATDGVNNKEEEEEATSEPKTCSHFKRKYLPLSKSSPIMHYLCLLPNCNETVSIQNEKHHPKYWASHVDRNAFEFFPCECAQFGLPSWKLFDEEDDEHFLLRCHHCPHVVIYLPKNNDDYRLLLSSGNYGKRHAIVKLTNIRQLSPADHVIFNRTLYEHHALVVAVNIEQETFTVCHYLPDSPSDDAAAKAHHQPEAGSLNSIGLGHSTNRLDEYALADYLGKVNKVYYLPMDVNHPEESIERALDAIGEVYYSLTKNNCEHFVSRIKTNQSKSAQVNRIFWWRR